MGKIKKPRAGTADVVHAKKSTVKEKILNPFEVHLNKEKFSILGRKCKHDRGLPGVSRAKAIKKRKQTLGQEFQELHKVNKFKDRRIGGEVLQDDEVAAARFVTEKMMQFKTKKKNIFNLNDEEILTHRGQTLEEIEQFRDPVSDESEDEALDAEFTEAAHFGDGKDADDRKAAIEEMIAEAKRKKVEIAKEKDAIFELTTKLDENYKQLIPLMGKLKKKEDEKKPIKDDYDRILKEMIFEPRGEVTDKLKSEEEIAKKEKERLEKLEIERLARMRGDELEDEKPKHKSADDLDDGYFAGSGEEDNDAVLAYDLNDNPNASANHQESSESIDDENASELSEVEENESEGDEDDDNLNNESENEITDESVEDEDNLSDLKDSESEPEIENIRLEKKSSAKKIQKTKQKSTKDDLKLQAEKELPYTYEMPYTYEELYDLLSKQSPDYQHIIVERIIKCNHPKLDASNREKLVKFFGFLLQYLNDKFSEVGEANIEDSFIIFDRLAPHLYDLSHMNPEKTSNCFLEVLKEKYDDFKKNQNSFPSVDFVVFFKLASNLFSTSDFRHLIITPCFIFMSHILSRSHVKSRCDISVGLFIITLILEYTQFSKRFLPAALNFLYGVIFLSIPKRPIEIIKVVPPFQSIGPQSNILVLSGKIDKNQKEEKLNSRDLVTKTLDDNFKVRALNTTLKLLNDFIDNLKDNVGSCYLSYPFLELLEKLDLVQYPDFIHQSYNNLKTTLETVQQKPMHFLVAEQKKPKALKLMEPRIEKVFDDKRRPKMSKEKEMRAIMLHKVKRETKGAIREIRRDTAFLTKLQIKKQLQSDMERKEKVHRIFSEAAAQQGELNALTRKRKKM